LVKKLIGVIPQCDVYLEIWPTGFRSYNVMVPNLLNLPFLVWGVNTAPPAAVGLAMYCSSRGAECPYCSAHACSFALRRGAQQSTMRKALDPTSDVHKDAERAVISTAVALGKVPSEITQAHRDELKKHFNPEDLEWIIHAVGNMGFLNKFMDGVGFELEEASFNSVIELMKESKYNPGSALAHTVRDTDATLPPDADSAQSKAETFPLLPQVMAIDMEWTAGVPDKWPEVGEWLKAKSGNEFSFMAELKHGRAVKAMATMIRDNLDASTTVTGLLLKGLIAVIFATITKNKYLIGVADSVAKFLGASDEQIASATAYATGTPLPSSFDAHSNTVLRLGKAVSFSPAAINEDVIDACSAHLKPQEIIEVVVWVGVNQMVQRESAYWVA